VKQLPTTLAVLKITVLTPTVKNLLSVSGGRVAAKGRAVRGGGGAGRKGREVSLKSFWITNFGDAKLRATQHKFYRHASLSRPNSAKRAVELCW
jgi:hypothetical protein